MSQSSTLATTSQGFPRTNLLSNTILCYCNSSLYIIYANEYLCISARYADPVANMASYLSDFQFPIGDYQEVPPKCPSWTYNKHSNLWYHFLEVLNRVCFLKKEKVGWINKTKWTAFGREKTNKQTNKLRNGLHKVQWGKSTEKIVSGNQPAIVVVL